MEIIKPKITYVRTYRCCRKETNRWHMQDHTIQNFIIDKLRILKWSRLFLFDDFMMELLKIQRILKKHHNYIHNKTSEINKYWQKKKKQRCKMTTLFLFYNIKAGWISVFHM